MKPIYYFIKFLLKFGFRGYYRKIYYSGIENIPKNKPVMFVANHTNTLIDPIIIATFIKRETYFITRGDIFGKPLVKWFFKQVQMLPIFRRRDGVEKMKLNEATFEKCYEILENKKAIIIFIEGDCEMVKRLRSLTKGTARIVYKVEEDNDFGLDVQIIPVGLNYTYHHKYQTRSDVMVSFGKPIPVKNYEETYKNKGKGRAINKLNTDIKKGMLNELVHIEKEEDDQLAEQLFQLHRNNQKYKPLPIKKSDRSRLELEQNIANKVNKNRQENEEIHEKFAQKVDQYFKDLEKHGIDDLGMSETYKPSALRSISLIISYPIYLIGYWFNRFPIFRGKRLAETLIKDPIFYAAVFMVSSMLLYGFFGFILFLTTTIVLNVWWGIAISFGLMLLGLDALIHLEYQEINKSVKKYTQFKKTNAKEVERLRKERKEIVAKS